MEGAENAASCCWRHTCSLVAVDGGQGEGYGCRWNACAAGRQSAGDQVQWRCTGERGKRERRKEEGEGTVIFECEGKD